MSQSSPEVSQGRRVLINLVGAVGLVFGVLAIVKYVLDLSFLDLSVLPYEWLGLEGAMRFVPPVMVLVACTAATYLLERTAKKG